MSAKKPQLSPRIFWLASCLFFISGGTGLAYQVVWFKRFSHVWGSSSLAFAAVGGSFLFGLGLGAYLLGRYADRMTLPLRWYGVCELAIGWLALVIPFEIVALVDASVELYAGIPQQPFLRFLVQFFITLVVIGPPCALMGGTLPLLIRQLTASAGPLDQATGWLYAINTFGAAAGCYLTGFHLLPSFGLLWTNNVAASINIAIGLVAILASRSAERRAPARTPPTVVAANAAVEGRGNLRLAGLYAAAALSGCGALMLEMIWTRQLALLLGGSTYAYTATLCVVLVGIALGSLIFHWRLRHVATSARLAVGVIGVLIVATLVGKLLLPSLALVPAPQSVRAMRGDPFWNGVICVGMSGALEFLPAVAMGLLFPLFVRMTQAGAASVGSAVGNIYAWNTLGSIVGASLTALLLFPRIGTAGAMAVALGLYVVALLAVLPWKKPADFAWGTGAALAAAGLIAWVAQGVDPRLTNLGFYIYGEPEIAIGGGDWVSKVQPRFFREGASCNVFVSVTGLGVVSLRVNGKVDASSGADMVTQLGAAYVPRIFKPDAKEVMVIGFGSGCTPGASLLFPGTRVTCCEIEPAVYEASPEFADYNHRPQEKSRSWIAAHNAELPPDEQLSPEQIDEQARFSMIFGDGRTAVQGARQKYDLMISEPSNPWMAGVSNLLTREFAHTAREHLTEDGVLAQWLQTYQFTLSDYLMIVRTLRTEFPHVGVILFANGLDTVILASRRPLTPRPEDLAALQEIVDHSPEISADLRRWFGKTDLRRLLVQNYQLGEEQIKRLLDRDRSRVLNTDLHPRLEFDAPLQLFRNLPPRDSATLSLLSAVEMPWIERLAVQTGIGRESAEFHLVLGDHLRQRASNTQSAIQRDKAAEMDRAATEYQAAIRLQPELADAYRGLAQLRTQQNRDADAAAALREVVRLAPHDPVAHAELALALSKGKQPAEAVARFREALRLRPEVSIKAANFAWANNLAWILATSPDASLRNGREAVAWARQACRAVAYQDASMLDTLAAALAEAGQFDEAIEVSRQQIEAAAGEPALVETARARIKLYEAAQPFRDQ